MADGEKKDKQLAVCWPDDTPEYRSVLIKIIDNYIPRYAGAETETTIAEGHPAVVA